MKYFFKSIVSQILQNDIAWRILYNTVVRASEFIKSERIILQEPNCKQVVNHKDEILSISPDLIVKHGPFKGMKYPDQKSVGSALIPKIVGSYESELHQIIGKICNTDYSEIVDIGCAEGYYAVGLAMRIPTARVFAYDIKSQAIDLCRQMAQINNVADRVTTGSFCDINTLKSIPFTKKALIISDCEGYEKQLFTQQDVSFFANCDLLIEIHDFIDPSISSTLRKCFSDTHSITVIESISHVIKANCSYCYEELQDYGLVDRRRLLSEGRPTTMKWFYLKPNL
ncbi:MAG: methyltransferase domain-containing protein [Okeania sp. SIO3H1]|nr:methyltransferase domain-containing protein [Okeania sp. SIO3H1]